MKQDTKELFISGGDWTIERSGQFSNRTSILSNGRKTVVIEHYSDNLKEREYLDNMLSQAKNMYRLLEEEVKYLNHWMNEIDTSNIMYTHMKERREFIEQLLRKANPY